MLSPGTCVSYKMPSPSFLGSTHAKPKYLWIKLDVKPSILKFSYALSIRKYGTDKVLEPTPLGLESFHVYCNPLLKVTDFIIGGSLNPTKKNYFAGVKSYITNNQLRKL